MIKETKPSQPAVSEEDSPSTKRSSGRRVVSALWRVVSRLLRGALSHVPAPQFESLLRELVADRANALEPAEALRVLFRLDKWLYEQEDRKAVEYGGGVHTKHLHTGYHDFFVRRIAPGQRVLDVGCGAGVVASEVARRCNAQVVAIDLDAERIAEARSRHLHPNVEYVVGDATSALPPGPFDAVILSNVLEHIEQRVNFLRLIVRNARPSRILIRVPTRERDWRVPLKQELGMEWLLDGDHKTEYTLESFAAEMQQANLRVQHIEVRWGEIWAEVAPNRSDS